MPFGRKNRTFRIKLTLDVTEELRVEKGCKCEDFD